MSFAWQARPVFRILLFIKVASLKETNYRIIEFLDILFPQEIGHISLRN